ncbi:hypothetical protein ACHAW5_001594, partial [Stephanodiscus triporus]
MTAAADDGLGGRRRWGTVGFFSDSGSSGWQRRQATVVVDDGDGGFSPSPGGSSGWQRRQRTVVVDDGGGRQRQTTSGFLLDAVVAGAGGAAAAVAAADCARAETSQSRPGRIISSPTRT